MNYVNYDAVIETLISHEFDVSQLEIGSMRRVKRGRRSQKGWYIVHGITLDDGQSALIGSFGYFEGAEKFQEKIAPGKEHKLSKEQLEAIRKQHAEATKKAEAQRKAEAERASHEATRAWFKYLPEGESQYFQRKMVRAHGVKFAPSGNGTVAIPMKDTAGKVWGLQIIRGKDRGNKMEKEYWPKGLNKKGHFHTLGSLTPHTKCVLIGEGYATCATLFQATEIPTLVAFDAGNLQEVAIAVHKAYPRAKILICADDDYLTDGNPGCKKAEAAAVSVGGAWIKPEFPASREGKKLTDFNDLANFQNCSESTVRVQILDKLNQLGWGYEAASAPRAAAHSKGSGGDRKKAVSIMDIDALVDRFIYIDDVTGGYVFDTWTHDVCKKEKLLSLMPSSCRFEFIKSHPLWQDRAVYVDQIGFDPGNHDKNIICNRWQGWPMQPKKGKCTALIDLLKYLCSAEDENYEALFDWVIKWLAYPLQNAGAKMHSAIVIHGNQGTGKSMFMEAYAKIFGEYAAILNQGALDDKFNADWAEKKQFVLADEVAANSEKYQLKNQLKTLITGEWVRVNPKNVAAHRERNHMNLVFLSNESMPVVLENDDRRHCIIKTPEAQEQEYYDNVSQEIENGGIEALYSYLLEIDLTGFTPATKPPISLAKDKLIWLSSGSDQRFIADWLNGYIESIPVCPIPRQILYDEYKSWAMREGEHRYRSAKDFFDTVENRKGWTTVVSDRYKTLNSTEKVSVRLIVPSIDDLERVAKNKNIKDMRMLSNEYKIDWYTRCYFEVINQIEKAKEKNAA